MNQDPSTRNPYTSSNHGLRRAMLRIDSTRQPFELQTLRPDGQQERPTTPSAPNENSHASPSLPKQSRYGKEPPGRRSSGTLDSQDRLMTPFHRQASMSTTPQPGANMGGGETDIDQCTAEIEKKLEDAKSKLGKIQKQTKSQPESGSLWSERPGSGSGSSDPTNILGTPYRDDPDVYAGESSTAPKTKTSGSGRGSDRETGDGRQLTKKQREAKDREMGVRWEIANLEGQIKDLERRRLDEEPFSFLACLRGFAGAVCH